MASWLRAAVYDASLRTAEGGVRGPYASLMLRKQQKIAASPELKEVYDAMSEVTLEGNHITITLSKADLIQLGAYAAVQYCGGPEMVFKMGRPSIEEDESQAV